MPASYVAGEILKMENIVCDADKPEELPEIEDCELLKSLYDNALDRDQRALDLADTFDVKASAVLVLVVFAVPILRDVYTASAWRKWTAVIGLLSLILSATQAVYSLWLRGYKYPPKPKPEEDWLNRLQKYYSAEQERDLAIHRDILRHGRKLAWERAEQNDRINEHRANLIIRSFWLALPGFATSLVLPLIDLMTKKSS
jgi:hypothetical protein